MHYRRVERRTRAQLGLASLELVLCLPVLLIMVLLAFNVARQAQTRLDVIGAGRTAAFKSSYGLSALLGYFSTTLTNTGQPIVVKTAPITVSQQSDLLTRLRNEPSFGQSAARQRTGILDTQAAGVQQTKSYALYIGSRALPSWLYVVQDQYDIVAAPAWERVDFPIGYDSYLHGDVGMDSYMPNAFPRAR